MAIGKGSANKVTLLGNLGATPELARTKSGAAVTTLALATNEVWKDNEGNSRNAPSGIVWFCGGDWLKLPANISKRVSRSTWKLACARGPGKMTQATSGT